MKLTKNQKRKAKVSNKKKHLSRVCEGKPKVVHKFIKNGISIKMKKDTNEVVIDPIKLK